MEVELPAGLYGMAVAEPAALDRKTDGNFMYFVELVRVHSMLLLCYVVSCLFLVHIWKINEGMTVAECSGKTLLVELGCVFLFEVRMLVDIRKPLTIITLLWAAPLPKSGSRRYMNVQDASPRAGAVLANESATKTGMLARMYHVVRRRPSTAQMNQWKLCGISPVYRTWCLLIVGMPALAQSLLLAYLGGVYIMKSGDESAMVVSTLAVVFVSEIEEFLYVAFTSDAMRYSLENMQVIEMELSNRQRLVSWFASSIVCPMLVVGIALLLVRHTRQMDCQEFSLSLKDILAGFPGIEADD